MIVHVKPCATRKSIKKLFPLGSVYSKGSNNPITLHAADDDAFARVWSLIAETMVAKSHLSRTLKEKVATLVSKKNQCPVCILNHTILGEGSSRIESDRNSAKGTDVSTKGTTAEGFEVAVLEYADAVVEATWNESEGAIPEGGGDLSVPLDDKIKAEVAMIVLLFTHMNRVVNAILRESFTNLMFKMNSDPRKVEATSLMNAISRLVAPWVSRSMKEAKAKPGCTEHLFAVGTRFGDQFGSSTSVTDLCSENRVLPSHLEGVKVAGKAREKAVGRLLEWSEQYYETCVKTSGLLPEHLLAFLEGDPAARPPRGTTLSHKVLSWISSDASNLVRSLDADSATKATIVVLLFTRYAPKAVQNCSQWRQIVTKLGESGAHALVIWWSIRCTLREAKGFEY